MKKALLSLLVVLLIVPFANAQYVQRPEQDLPDKPYATSAPPVFNLEIVDNNWLRTGLPYSKEWVTALLTKILIERLGWHAGRDVQAILKEAHNRDLLKQVLAVNQSSPRLKDGTIDVPGWHVKAVLNGSSDNRRGALRAGNVRIGGETGSSEAWVVLTFTDLVTLREVAVVVGSAKSSSTNLEDFGINLRSNRTLLGIPLGNRVDWNAYDRNPGYRRGMLSTGGALENLQQQLLALKALLRS